MINYDHESPSITINYGELIIYDHICPIINIHHYIYHFVVLYDYEEPILDDHHVIPTFDDFYLAQIIDHNCCLIDDRKIHIDDPII